VPLGDDILCISIIPSDVVRKQAKIFENALKMLTQWSSVDVRLNTLELACL
jgi:hypothetical protein